MAVYVAYSLAIQAIMASVGLGMAAGAVLNQVDFAFCSFDFNQTNTIPAPNGDGQKHNPAPLCPFCFIVGQSAGHAATAGEAVAFPVYVGLAARAISAPIGEGTLLSRFRHRHGEPRAPPAFSV